MGCEFCHTVVLSADNLTIDAMEAGEGRTMVRIVLQQCYIVTLLHVYQQMVGRGEEGEGEGLTLAQFMGSYYR